MEHGYPCSRPGWVVVVLATHAEALHDIPPEAATELGQLLLAVGSSLREVMGSTKEYVSCLSDLTGFEHIHFHLVARLPTDAGQVAGKQLLVTLRAADGVVPAGVRRDIQRLCRSLRPAVTRRMAAYAAGETARPGLVPAQAAAG
ncbi:MAG: hypothetical protein IT204_04835 [Fimbriimonadaceae bacterium]|nr:hypothetical protein [Fimbriimonadaceae bacterium]